MARPAKEDLFHSFRFFATAVDSAGGNPLAVPGKPEAGFQAVTVPEYTMEAVEYREGHHIFTRKFPGMITTADLTFSRGVVFGDTGFYDWLLQGGAGGGEYRANIEIFHIHRTALPVWNSSAPNFATNVPINALLTVGYRQYTVHEAIPTRVKPAGDLESTTSDVSIAEADVAYEYFTVADHAPTP